MGRLLPLLLTLASLLSFFQIVIGLDTLELREELPSSNDLNANREERSLPIPESTLDQSHYISTRHEVTSDILLDEFSADSFLGKRHQKYPLAFDANIGNNFTSESCPNFFTEFLRDRNVRACLPVSLMMQTSGGWFDASKSAKQLHRVLNKACSASAPSCTILLSEYAARLVSDNACGEDYKQQNPIVIQAYNGLLAFPEVFNSTCLKNTDKSEGKHAYNEYCLINALMNQSAPTGSFVYYIPLGLPLPSQARPTCDTCLKNVMNGFALYASNSTLPISKTYPGAANIINGLCGSDFVQSQIKIEGSAPMSKIPTRGAWVVATLTLLFILLP